jgi:AraC-like DNA-binding protein
MKPIFQKLAPSASHSIIYKGSPHFIIPWHFHPEIEILYVLKSSGKCYIGDSINNFAEGDICIIGENVPHWWKGNNSPSGTRETLNPKALVIQFNKEIFDSNVFSLPEMSNVIKLLHRSRRGMMFSGKSRKKLGCQVEKIFRLSGVKKITELMLLLDRMASSDEYKYLSSVGYSDIVNTFEFYRFNKVHEFIINNYTREIKLEEAANAANMCTTSFCRYFKKHTGKTFFSFLNEFRIGHACKLLQEENMTVSRACIQSGFNNLSHFNKQFRKIINHTPSEYQKEHSRVKF